MARTVVKTSSAPRVAHGTDKRAVLSLKIPKIYLKLQFMAPGENTPRVFPAGLHVKVLWGTGRDARWGIYVVSDKGLLVFPAKLPNVHFPTFKVHVTWLGFTLAWDADVANVSQYIVCEAPGAASQSCELAVGGELAARATGGKRYFALPQEWGLKYADWDASSAQFTKETGRFRQTDASKLQAIGDESAPVTLTLNPNWRYYRFLFFDRYYGPAK
jgi:hypothetical protein